MMSIIIKDMEMPKSCDDCWFECAYEICTPETGYENCPLIEIPKHGRLIDADDLYIHLNEWYLTNNPVFTKEEALYIRAMLLGIVEAPTIIPASEDGET